MLLYWLARLNQNCTNSSRPPSSSPFIKPHSLRVKSGLKPGGQPGHKGSTLQIKENPDVVVDYTVDTCHHCGNNLSGETATISQTRQVWDVKVDHYIQYGDHYKSLMIYLSKGNFIPYDRLAAFSQDVLDIPVSQGTVVNMVYEFGHSLKKSTHYIKDHIKQSPVVHLVEVGTRTPCYAFGIANTLNSWSNLIS
jgi:transposase